MVGAFDENRSSLVVQPRQDPVVADAKLVVVGADHPGEVSYRLFGGLLQFRDDSARDGSIEPAQGSA